MTQSEVRSQSLQVAQYCICDVASLVGEGLPHFCFVVLGMGKGKKKLLTLLVETSSQEKKKVHPKIFKILFKCG